MDPTDDVESWATRYVESTDLHAKLAPPPPPSRFGEGVAPRRIALPGRPPELAPLRRPPRRPKLEALGEPLGRARALHAFFHHELQAAELMCWALVRFSDAEAEFRRSLLGICLDEIRHMNLYREHIEALGFSLGAFGVRDWFWKRVPTCEDKVAFVSLLGMGFEAANLEHAQNFAARFREVGDVAGALVQERIAAEEIAHVSFATHWFSRWTGGLEFDEWVRRLPPPITPWVLHGTPIAEDARRRAGMPDDFIAALAAYVPEPKDRVR